MKLRRGYLLLLVLFVFLIIFIIGYALQEIFESGRQANADKIKAITKGPFQEEGLGTLCFNEEECKSYCLDNRERCEQYCEKNANELCREIFTASPISQDEQQTDNEDEPPVLKNLGIILDTPNLETKRAGDLLFDKKVVWEDGGSYSDKAFGEFGELGKRKDIPNFPGVEYNYAVPIGTKVYAAGDGIVRVSYIEHTQDWGINIQPRAGSKWNIGHEHIINLKVKNGDIVKAGDVLGEATPNKIGYATTQLSVWTGGKGIVKFCPFSFLDDGLEYEYEEILENIAEEWEKFIGKDVYDQGDWIAPGCLLDKIIEAQE